MKKPILLLSAIVTSFCFGFAFKTIITEQTSDHTKTRKATGIGGIFF